MQNQRLLAVLLPALVVACGPPRRVVEGCSGAWNARISTVEKVAGELDELKSGGGSQRKLAADQAIAQADGRLRGLTVPAKDILLYPDQLRVHLASSGMKVTGVSPTREEPGTALRAVHYEIEAHGDYRLVPKLVNAFYSQPKAVFVDRLEVNIAEETTRRSTVKAEVHVLALQEPSTPPEIPAEFTSAIAELPAPAECAGVNVDKAVADRWGSERAALATRRSEAMQLGGLVAREADARTRTALAGDLSRKRDDNKAIYTTHTDELIQEARTAVTGFAILKLKPNGEPLIE